MAEPHWARLKFANYNSFKLLLLNYVFKISRLNSTNAMIDVSKK